MGGMVLPSVYMAALLLAVVTAEDASVVADSSSVMEVMAVVVAV